MLFAAPIRAARCAWLTPILLSRAGRCREERGEALPEQGRRRTFARLPLMTTEPVVNEIHTCIATDRRLLVFTLPAQNRDEATQRLLKAVTSGYLDSNSSTLRQKTGDGTRRRDSHWYTTAFPAVPIR